MNDTAAWVAMACLALWGAALTVLVMRSSNSSLSISDKGAPAPSGPVTIKNFIKDKFGNIIKKDKRAPRRGDDAAAFLAEQKENDK